MDINKIDRWRSRLTSKSFLAVMGLLITAVIFLLTAYLCNVLDLLMSCFATNNLSGMAVPPFVFNFVQYKIFYGVGLLLGLFLSFRVLYTIYSRNMEINKGQKGSSSWTELEELKAQYKAVPEKEKRYKGNGGVLISRHQDKIYIDDSPVNNLIIGTTRSGKGETYIIPTIDVYSRAEIQPSLIVNDPKGELASACIPVLRQRGYNTHIFNLVNPLEGIGFNPLELIKQEYLKGDYGAAQLITRTFSFMLFNDPSAKDKTWQNWAIALSNALILAHVIDCVKEKQEEKINMYSCVNMVTRLATQKITKELTYLDYFFDSREDTDIAKAQYSAVRIAPSRTKNGIIAQLLNKYELFTYDNIAKMTAKNSVDLEAAGYDMQKPTAIFMCVPDYDSSMYFLASLFIRQMYYVLAKKASGSKGGRCPREVVFMLDEFGNMPAIPDMANIITVCLGRNIRFNLVVQAYEMIDSLYGANEAKTIVSNCGNQIYLLTTEYGTAERFSKNLGNETIVTYGRSGDSRFNSPNLSEHIDTKPLLYPADLLAFEEGEAAVFRAIKRQNLRKKRIKPKPIHNIGETRLKYRWEYLPEFDTLKTLKTVTTTGSHAGIVLEDIIYYPEETFSDSVFMDETDSFATQVTPVTNNTMLKEFMNTEELINLNSCVGIDNDYPNMSYGEFLSFMVKLVEIKATDMATASKAMKYVDELKEKGVGKQ